MQIGIMQGRLSDAPKGEDLDWYPIDSWGLEFPTAAKLGFSYIELVIDRKGSLENPILNNYGREKLRKLMQQTGIIASHCCINSIINEAINSDNQIKNILKVMNYCNELNVGTIILPLFGESEPDARSKKSLINTLSLIVNNCSSCGIDVLLETNQCAEQFENFFGDTEFYDQIGLVYDIGNATNSKKNITRDLQTIINKIKHIHIKDKDLLGNNVSLNSGMVDFSLFIKDILEFGYEGKFTLETTRGESALLEASKNLNFFRDVYNCTKEATKVSALREVLP